MATTPAPDQTPDQARSTGPAPGPNPGQNPRRHRWLHWLGAFVLGGSLLAVAIAVGALTLARYDIIDKLSGFIGFMMMLNPVRVLAILAGIAFVLGLVLKGPRWKALAGLVLSGGLMVAMYTAVIVPAGQVPPLHDITTNLDDPPAFRTLPLREDNLVPFTSIDEWRAAHRAGYPDIAPILLELPPAEALARARALAEARGWEIAGYNAATGHLEATATAGYLRFYDDVVIRVTPVADGSSRVDMRSVSRVGVSDLGYNAARIRDFLADMQAS